MMHTQLPLWVPPVLEATQDSWAAVAHGASRLKWKGRCAHMQATPTSALGRGSSLESGPRSSARSSRTGAYVGIGLALAAATVAICLLLKLRHELSRLLSRWRFQRTRTATSQDDDPLDGSFGTGKTASVPSVDCSSKLPTSDLTSSSNLATRVSFFPSVPDSTRSCQDDSRFWNRTNPSILAASVSTSFVSPCHVALETPPVLPQTGQQILDHVLREEATSDRWRLLEKQLDAAFSDGSVLLRKYKLLSPAHRRFGGQGVVQFASCVYDKSLTFALKFYLSWEAFCNERDVYAAAALQDILPPVACICGNEDGSVEALGWPLPPMLVLEKGECLSEWTRRSQTDFVSSLQIIMHVLRRVNDLHRGGYCHRDIKPSNIVLLYSTNEWTVIDYASAARIGTLAPLSFSMAYAAPEVLQAARHGDGYVLAEAAADVWSLGVMSYELLTRKRMFHGFSHNEVLEMAAGNVKYPWERADTPLCAACLTRLGFMKDVILRMLQRDPSARISLQEARDAWQCSLGLDAAADGDEVESLMLATMPSCAMSTRTEA